jgi:hypothetical protein
MNVNTTFDEDLVRPSSVDPGVRREGAAMLSTARSTVALMFRFRSRSTF